MKMTKLLLALDLTENDDRLVDVARSMAQATGAHVECVHVFPPEVTAMDYLAYVPIDPKHRHEALEKAEKTVSQWVSRLGEAGVKSDGTVVSGHSAQCLLDEAEAKKVSLIVIGSHSRNFMGRALLGSTADKVVRCAQCPVLVVPFEGASGVN